MVEFVRWLIFINSVTSCKEIKKGSDKNNCNKEDYNKEDCGH